MTSIFVHRRSPIKKDVQSIPGFRRFFKSTLNYCEMYSKLFNLSVTQFVKWSVLENVTLPLNI